MKFENEYDFLSNAYEAKFMVYGIQFKTVNHFYQTHITNNLNLKLKIINSKTSDEIKEILQKHKNYVSVSQMLSIMRLGVKYKFQQNPWIATKLLQIKEPIIFENDYMDMFWGICNRNGLNYLGQIIDDIKYSILIRIKTQKLSNQIAILRDNNNEDDITYVKRKILKTIKK